MGVVTCQVFALDNTLAHDPISGVLVRVFDETGTTLITTGVTDGSGQVSFDLMGTPPPSPTMYQLRLSKIGVSFVNPEYAQVYDPLPPNTANKFNIYGDTHALSPALNPEMCRAEGFLLDPGGRPIKDLMIRIMNLFEPVILNNAGLIHKLEVRTDSRGWVALELPRKGHFVATVSGMQDERLEIHVPDRSSVALVDLLWPVVAEVSFLPAAPWVVPSGTSLDVIPTVTASSYYVLEGAAIDDVSYASTDSSVVSVEQYIDKIVLRGNKPGTAHMTVTRKDKSVRRIPDTPIIGTGGLITVT